MNDININYLPQFSPLWEKSWSELYIHGGRGTGKSYAVAEYVIIYMLSNQNTRILICRETSKSIEDSAYENIVSKIRYHNLDNYFDILKTSIECKLTKTKIIFSGMLPHHIGAIKSKENIKLCWIEEAQYICEESLNVAIPTFVRNNGVKIIYTINPRFATDAVYKRFNGEEIPENSIMIKTSCNDNPFFSEGMKAERRFNYKTMPEMARHIWEGELMPSGNDSAVIPLNWLKKCVDTHNQLNLKLGGYEYIGFDVADSGNDSCAIAYRRGALLKDTIEFNNEFISQSVEFVHNYTKDKNIARIHYDATGIGAGAKSDFNRINKRYLVQPFLGASKPKGYDINYLDNITNSQYFRNLKAQSWWSLRIKVENTLRLLDGENININNCFFIDKNISNLDKLMLELSQASYKHEDGKLMVDKQPNNESSPNLGDAIVMSFVHDLRNGLKAK